MYEIRNNLYTTLFKENVHNKYLNFYSTTLMFLLICKWHLTEKRENNEKRQSSINSDTYRHMHLF